MNSKIKKITKDFSYTVIANLLSIIISTVLILIVPRFVNVVEYGYWQLYLFYVSYISYMSFGITDGALLRYGGQEYKVIPKKIFVSQFWLLIILNIIIYSLIIYFYSILVTDTNKELIIFLTCMGGLLIVPRSLITFILQATGRIKEYSKILIIEKVVYFILVILLLLFGMHSFFNLVFADLIGKLVSIVYSILIARELVIGKFETFRISFNETIINMKVGSKVLFANLSSMFIIGIVRFGIEYRWGVETFGKVSLTLSICNMLLLFLNGVSVVLFPTLRKMSINKLPILYNSIRSFMTIPILGLLIIIYPLREFLLIWLTEYEDSINYMIILFPMCIYESITIMLINTYLKTLRKEKAMLIINLITVLISLIITIINIFVLSNFNLAILSILLLLIFRSIVGEVYLTKVMNIKIRKDFIYELILTTIFIIANCYLDKYFGIIIYIIFYLMYLIIKRSDLKKLLTYIKFRGQ